jgi:hypothetical protein
MPGRAILRPAEVAPPVGLDLQTHSHVSPKLDLMVKCDEADSAVLDNVFAALASPAHRRIHARARRGGSPPAGFGRP